MTDSMIEEGAAVAAPSYFFLWQNGRPAGYAEGLDAAVLLAAPLANRRGAPVIISDEGPSPDTERLMLRTSYREGPRAALVMVRHGGPRPGQRVQYAPGYEPSRAIEEAGLSAGRWANW